MTAEYPVPALLEGAHVDAAKYEEMYAASVADPEGFWAEQGKRIDWIKPFSKVKDTSYAHDDVHIRWYEDGTLNVSANCIDRHVASRGDQVAILFEPDEPTDPVQSSLMRNWPSMLPLCECSERLGRRQGRPCRDLHAHDP